MQQITARIDQILQSTLAQYKKQNNSFITAKQSVVQNGLQVPNVQNAPNNISLFNALDTTAGRAAFIGSKPFVGKFGLPSGVARNLDISRALTAGQGAITADVAQRNANSVTSTTAVNANTLAKLNLQKPSANITSLLSTIAGRQNTVDRISAAKTAASLTASKSQGGLTIPQRISIAKMLGKPTPVSIADQQALSNSQPSFSSDITVVRTKDGSTIVQQKEPTPLPDAAITDNANRELKHGQAALLGGLTPSTTKVHVMMPSRAGTGMFGTIFDGTTPNVDTSVQEITIPPKDYQYIQPLLKDHGYDIIETLNTINQNLNNPNIPTAQKQAWANFKMQYEPIVAAAVVDVPSGAKPIPLSNLSNRQYK